MVDKVIPREYRRLLSPMHAQDIVGQLYHVSPARFLNAFFKARNS